MAETCTRRIQFCAGHRVFGHEGQCAHMHGHNYVAFITARAGELDSVGRVIDFAALKDLVGGWLLKAWDHGFLWFKDDCEMKKLFAVDGPLHKHKNYQLSSNPTAENMADYLLRTVSPLVLRDAGVDHITVIHVRLWETENCYADASL